MKIIRLPGMVRSIKSGLVKNVQGQKHQRPLIIVDIIASIVQRVLYVGINVAGKTRSVKLTQVHGHIPVSLH